MVEQVQQTLDALFWALNQVLDHEGIKVLHWAIVKRASLHGRGVRFSEVMNATGQPKDNVRRAAKFLQESKQGEVMVYGFRFFLLRRRTLRQP